VAALLLPVWMASCSLPRGAYVQPAPLAFQQTPDLPAVIQAVNANSRRVAQLRADQARLTIDGAISGLQARLDFDRPHRFRLLAETGLTGRELDLGSNDNVYWMWAKRLQPPTVFYGHHDQFFRGAAQHVLPVPPHWLVEALGIVHLDPAHEHEGPIAAGDGRWQLRTRFPTPRGPLTRIMEIDARYAWVLQQQLFDANGQPLASVVASGFRYDPAHAVSLPDVIRVDFPPAELSFSLETEGYVVNQPLPDTEAQARWTLPELTGHQYVDIGDPRQFRDRPPDRASADGQLLADAPRDRAAEAVVRVAEQPRWMPEMARESAARRRALPQAALRRLPAFSAIR
jgi:hypothetical protein